MRHSLQLVLDAHRNRLPPSFSGRRSLTRHHATNRRSDDRSPARQRVDHETALECQAGTVSPKASGLGEAVAAEPVEAGGPVCGRNESFSAASGAVVERLGTCGCPSPVSAAGSGEGPGGAGAFWVLPCVRCRQPSAFVHVVAEPSLMQARTYCPDVAFISVSPATFWYEPSGCLSSSQTVTPWPVVCAQA